MSARREAALARLAELGVDGDGLLAGAASLERLARLLAGEAGSALVAALGELAAPEAAAALVALEPGARDRTVRREIRRALYRLRQAGIPTPTPPTPPPARRAPDDDIEGLVSHVDGRGDRLVWIMRTRGAGGTLLVATQINEPAGLRDLQVLEGPRRRIRAARHDIEHGSRTRLVPADWRILDALVAEAHGRAPTRPEGEQPDYLRARRELTADPPRPAAEPVSRLAPAPAADEAVRLAAAPTALLAVPEVASWGVDPEASAPFAEEIRGLQASPLILGPAQQRERVGAILRRAAETLFPPLVLARRLEGTAYVLAETRRPEAAREALAVALLLRSDPAEALGTPFVTALVERGLGTLVSSAEESGRETRRDSLVVTPEDYVRDRSSSRRQRLRG